MIEMPWSPRTRQEDGRKTESKVVKQRGGRAHPMSGAGSIKSDGSSEIELIEVKDANKTHTLNANDLFTLYRWAVQQDKEAVYVVQFKEKNIRATIHITVEGQ